MKDAKIQQILKAWLLAEVISNGEITNGKWIDATEDYDEIDKIRFNPNEKADSAQKTGFVIYFGEYKKQNIRTEIQKTLFGDQQFVTNPDDAVGYCLAVVVNHDWTLQKTFIPNAAYFYSLLTKGMDPENITYKLAQKEDFNEFQQQIEEQVAPIFDSKEQPIGEVIAHVDEIVCEEFGLESQSQKTFRGTLNFKKEPVLLNSFYLDDIQRVIDSESDDSMIKDYISEAGNNHLDVDKNWDFISELITPKKFPDGRWPGPIEFSQSLMQQVAVNIIRDKAINTGDIKTVNGPPGTGKTTLLKDVFADLIVDQAKAMAKLDSPKDGYRQIGKINLDSFAEHHYNAYALIPELQGYGVVVTSNNNSAVENITKDFPAKQEVSQHKANNGLDHYQDELEKIDYFSKISDAILARTDTWGLFSAQMGTKEKIENVYQMLDKKTDGKEKWLVEELHNAETKDTWKVAKNNFKQALKRVIDVKDSLQENIDKVCRYDSSEKDRLEEELANLNLIETKQQISDQSSIIDNKQKALEFLPKKRFLLWTWDTPERRELSQSIGELYQLTARLQSQLKVDEDKSSEIDERLKEQERLADEADRINNQLEQDGTIVGNHDYWHTDSAEVQINLPNSSNELQDARSELFIAAIRLRKAFIVGFQKPIINSCKIMEKEKSGKLIYPQDENILKSAFQIFQMLIPVISTTLASVQSMFKNFGENSIDQVFIDEAGQATPSSVIGIMWRAKRLVALGDPAQIEPVVTTNEATLRMIAREYGVDESYLSPQASVQQLADSSSYYGTYTDDENSWVGIPLWVHRRCLSPMFEIANEISYEGKMVQSNSAKPKIESAWLDSSGKVQDHLFVKEQVDVVAKSIISIISENDVELNDIYVISPFNAVVNGLRSELEKTLENGNVDKKWLDPHDGNVGTVHTFQGKAAKVVYFVIGTDENTDSAANWAFSKPNLLNVAVTRAKIAFFVVGDHKRLSSKNFIREADKYLKVIKHV